MNDIIATRIIGLISSDPAKIAVLKLLADGKWHTRFEVESAAKAQRPTIGIVGISVILKALQEADADLVETYENDSGRFFRLNPQRKLLLAYVFKKLQTTSSAKKEKMTPSAYQFNLFKERLKTRTGKVSVKDLDDEDLKQFL